MKTGFSNMKFLWSLKFSNQIFEEESCFWKLKFEVTSAFQPPGLECRNITRMNISDLKSNSGMIEAQKKSMLSGGNRFVGCVSFIIIYIFIMFQFEFIYLYEYSLNNFYFFDCIAGFWVISRHSNYPSSVEKHKLKRRGSREEQPAS